MSATVVTASEIIGTEGEQTETAVTFTRVYLVTLSAADSAGQDIALTATGLPAIGDAWPRAVAGRATPTVRTKKARLHDRNSRLIWQVEIEYSNEAKSGGGSSSESDLAPWLRTPTYRSAPSNYEVALEQDYSTPARLVRNSLGDAFDPVPTTVKANRMLTISRARLTWSESTAQSLQNTINSAPVTVRGTAYAAGALRLVNWSAESAEWTNDGGATIPYYEEVIEIEVATGADGHTLKILDQGYSYKTGDGNTARFTNDDGTTAPEPMLLDGAGFPGSSASPVFLPFQQYPKASWTPLGTL
jgi:hypothetical protein